MGIRAWLERIRVSDPVERRQAYILQVIVIVIIATFLAATAGNAIRAASGGAPANPVPNLTFVVVSVVLLLVLRRGQFRIATGVFVAFLVYRQLEADGPGRPVRPTRGSRQRRL